MLEINSILLKKHEGFLVCCNEDIETALFLLQEKIKIIEKH
jgi:hypothetical protein